MTDEPENKRDITKRDRKIIVRLHEDIYTRLTTLSDTHGHPPSSVAAWAISLWVVSQERQMLSGMETARLLVKEVADRFGDQFGALVKALENDQQLPVPLITLASALFDRGSHQIPR